MINLLNPLDLKEIKSGRINVKLRRYLFLTLFTTLAVGGIYLYGFTQANAELSNAEKQEKIASDQLQQYDEVKTAGQAYRKNLTMAKKVVDNQFSFSVYIDNIAAIMPSGTILDNLTLTTTALKTAQAKETPTVIPVRAKSYNDILNIKTAFENRSDLFKDVHITSTALAPVATGKNAAYPYTASLSVIVVRQKAST